MKKFTVIAVIGLCAVGGVLWEAEHIARQHMVNQVVTILSNSSTEKQINQLANHILGPGVGQTANPASSAPKSHNQSSISTTSSPITNSSASSKLSFGHQTKTLDGAKNTGVNNSKTDSSIDFTSRQQVAQFAMSHFTQSEIANYTYLYLHRNSLSEKKKAAIKAQILSHFTPQELQAMINALHRYQ